MILSLFCLDDGATWPHPHHIQHPLLQCTEGKIFLHASSHLGIPLHLFLTLTCLRPLLSMLVKNNTDDAHFKAFRKEKINKTHLSSCKLVVGKPCESITECIRVPQLNDDVTSLLICLFLFSVPSRRTRKQWAVLSRPHLRVGQSGNDIKCLMP